MIGVLARPEEEPAVREFFELFKTPWEFFRGGERYDVLLAAADARLDETGAAHVLLYSSRRTGFDRERSSPIGRMEEGSAECSFRGRPLPIYGGVLTFRSEAPLFLAERRSGEPLVLVRRNGDRLFVRVGYDLFREVETLLQRGQPQENAGSPALDLHVALLRDLITACGVALPEIPPAPEGRPFIACLTHDLDHASIRRHKGDATTAGFLYRATMGSAVKLARGRLSSKKLWKNWVAAAKLPLVHLGLAGDFWRDFDGYLDLEQGRPSTFFVIPFAHKPGRSPKGTAPRSRGAAYELTDVAAKVPRLQAAGCEIGLHGIDAWADGASGRLEAGRIDEISGVRTAGVRMHWLYRNEKSPAALEEADFAYDSTVGYNETIGYRAGTSQVYKPLGVARLLELPLHIMDTALFYPDYLDLSEADAWDRLSPIFDNAVARGGVATINWHDRSIAPERLWGEFYLHMLGDLTGRGAWFATAGQAVSWFRKRRSVRFVEVDGRLSVKISDSDDGLPGLRLRLHHPRPRLKFEEVIQDENGLYTESALGGPRDHVEPPSGSQDAGSIRSIQS